MADFEQSAFFKYFVTLQSSMEGVYIFDTRDFIVWLSQQKIPAKKWTSPLTLMNYKKVIAKRGRGLERASESMQNAYFWCETKGIEFNNFFKEFPIREVWTWIESDKLNPWFFLISSRFNDLVERMSDDQVTKLSNVVDFDYWDKRFITESDEVTQIKQLFMEIGH